MFSFLIKKIAKNSKKQFRNVHSMEIAATIISCNLKVDWNIKNKGESNGPPYYKKNCIYAIVSNLQERFPVVAVLTEDNVKKADYESWIEFKDSLESLCHTIIGHEETVEMSMQDALQEMSKQGS